MNIQQNTNTNTNNCKTNKPDTMNTKPTNKNDNKLIFEYLFIYIKKECKY